ncbi:tyrosine-type recombinase/integrase [Heliorestis convoluta]|uniref:Tyrosine recombinase XerC n=1 Tax=Heliorestis convoluta TaxID=356322 RepID=A0A5Q2NA70_9FIRM|nr:tyrosine-type recombinase/integrase [Heliorestis convoluta]QGG49365.1 Tyrosine recombinase XerC [Heliorestis convoluta]
MTKRRLPTIVTKEEVRKLISVINCRCMTGKRNLGLILLMYRSGLRVSEAVGLRTSQIQWAEGQIRIVGKGDKERVVPLDYPTIVALRDWKEVKPKGSKTFLCTLEGNPVNPRYVNAMLERYCKRAGIKRVHAHMLRHTCATELLNDDFNIREVQDILGHADIRTTQIYTHVNPIELRGKMKRRVL